MTEGAGWFADPGGKVSTYRWWDGAAWTRWLSADPAAPSPGPEAPPPSPSPEKWSQTAARAGEDRQSVTSFGEIGPAERVVRLPAAAAIVVGAVLLALVAVGSVITLTADRPSTGPAVAPPPRVEPPLLVRYDPATRLATVQELRVVLPAAPFTCATRPDRSTALFRSKLQCDAAVHQDFDAADNDWFASTGIGLLEEGQPDEADLRLLLVNTANALIARSYDTDRITVEKVKHALLPSTVAPPGRGRVVTAQVQLEYKGLPTAYDALQVAIVRLDSGRHVVWWGFRPEDSPDALTAALEASYATLTARK